MTKKRFLSFILVLTMALCLLPATAFAEAGDWGANLSVDDVSGYWEEDYYNYTASTTLEAGSDGQLRVMPITTIGYYDYNAMAYCEVTAKSSNTSVVEVKDGGIVIGKWVGGDWDGADCLQVNVNPKAAGTAVVTIGFFYTFSQSDNPITNKNARWLYGTMKYTVKVTEPAEQHKHSYTAAVTQDPTCTTPGVRTYTCECGDFYTEEISALGHDWGNWTVNKEPTYFEKGEQVRECQRENCDAVETEEIDRLVPPTSFGDLFINVNANSNIVKAYCGVNHWDYFKKADLDGCYTVNDLVFDETEGVWKATVTLDGYAIAEKYSAKYPKQGVHYVKDGSEVKVLTATFGQTEKWTLKYNNVLLSKATITVNMTCKPTCAHEWVEGVVTVEPTCTKDGIITYSCAHCEKTRQSAIAALGHDWDDGVVVKEPTVEEAGILRFSCSRCDEIRDVEITVSKPEAPTTAELKELCWFPDATYSFQVKDNNYKNNYTGIKNDQVVDECFGEFGKIYYDEKAELWKVDVELNASFFVDLFNRTYGSDAVSYKLYKNNVITICFDEARGWYADQTQFPAVVYVVK